MAEDELVREHQRHNGCEFEQTPGDSMCFLGGSASKESACNTGDLVLVPGSGQSPWRRE